MARGSTASIRAPASSLWALAARRGRRLAGLGSPAIAACAVPCSSRVNCLCTRHQLLGPLLFADSCLPTWESINWGTGGTGSSVESLLPIVSYRARSDCTWLALSRATWQAEQGRHRPWPCQATECARRRQSSLVPPWNCPGTALVLPWYCPGTALVLPWYCKRMFPSLVQAQAQRICAMAAVLTWYCPGVWRALHGSAAALRLSAEAVRGAGTVEGGGGG
jgi:hypothetical protein